jgi:hypothetical protein
MRGYTKLTLARTWPHALRDTDMELDTFLRFAIDEYIPVLIVHSIGFALVHTFMRVGVRKNIVMLMDIVPDAVGTLLTHFLFTPFSLTARVCRTVCPGTARLHVRMHANNAHRRIHVRHCCTR